MPIIESLLTQDLYKFSMCQVVLHRFPEAVVEYEFKCRNHVYLGKLAGELNEELDNLCSMTFTQEDLGYLKTIRFLKSDFIEFLRMFRFNREHIKVFVKDDLAITIAGPWWATIFFEIDRKSVV